MDDIINMNLNLLKPFKNFFQIYWDEIDTFIFSCNQTHCESIVLNKANNMFMYMEIIK